MIKIGTRIRVSDSYGISEVRGLKGVVVELRDSGSILVEFEESLAWFHAGVDAKFRKGHCYYMPKYSLEVLKEAEVEKFTKDGLRCCPMCGKFKVIAGKAYGLHYVHCNCCGMQSGTYSSVRSLKKAWNRFKRAKEV